MVIEMGFFENRKKNKLIKFVNSSDCSESVKKEAISKINDGTFTAQYQVSKFIEKSKKKAPKIIKNEEPPKEESKPESNGPKFLFSRELTADEYGELIVEHAVRGDFALADKFFKEGSMKYPEKKDVYFLCLAAFSKR